MNTTNNTSKLVILGLMTGILLLMAYTPLGYLNIGPLAITFNVIPVAIAAITLGPAGGAAIGAVFGMTSFYSASASAAAVRWAQCFSALTRFWHLYRDSFRVCWMVFC